MTEAQTSQAPLPKEYGEYAPGSSVEHWKAADDRHAKRNAAQLNATKHFFHPGSVLDVGTGCGGTAKILESLGFDVTGSDIQPFFMD